MRTVALIVPAESDAILGEAEDVVPEPRLEVILELREVEVRPDPRASSRSALREVHAEVEQSGRDVLTVDDDMALLQVPAARTHESTATSSFSA